MLWSVNGPDLNPIENLWWKLKKRVHEMGPTCKADLANGNQNVEAKFMNSIACYYLNICLLIAVAMLTISVN